MVTIAKKLQDFLGEHSVDYEVIHHRREYTSQETAADTHTPGKEFAKTVLLQIEGDYALAVLPAHHYVDLDRIREELGAGEVKLASESEMRDLCRDCEAGAIPPFGNLYELPVYLSQAMVDDERITFNAGSHEDAIRMRYQDYQDLTHPQIIDFSRPMHNA